MVDFGQWNERVNDLAHSCEVNCRIAQELYDEHDVKRGLRDKSGTGVLAGLTKISHIQSFEMKE